MEQDAFNATLITTAPELISGDDAYANTAATSDVAGCFPGVTP